MINKKNLTIRSRSWHGWNIKQKTSRKRMKCQEEILYMIGLRKEAGNYCGK